MKKKEYIKYSMIIVGLCVAANIYGVRTNKSIIANGSTISLLQEKPLNVPVIKTSTLKVTTPLKNNAARTFALNKHKIGKNKKIK